MAIHSGPAGLSVRGVAAWLRERAQSLSEHRINASLGRRHARPGVEPVVWISLTSEWAEGRLIRNSDGSSEIKAHRFLDGKALLDQEQPATTADQLDELAQACSRPPRAATAGAEAARR